MTNGTEPSLPLEITEQLGAISGQKVGYARVSSKDQNLDRQIEQLKAEGAVANFRRRAVTTQSSSSDARCGSAFSGSLEHPADDHRIRVRLPVGKHRALAFP